MVRWRIGKSALMAGTFSITFAGFAMRCPLAMPGSILESSCDGTSADAAPQFQFDEAVHFDRVLDGNPLRHHFSGPQDDHPEGFVLCHAAGRHVEEHLVAHLSDGSLLGDLRVCFVEFDRRGRLGSGLRIEHQRRPIDARFNAGGSRFHPHRRMQGRPSPAPNDAAVDDLRPGPRGEVDHLRADVFVLTRSREATPTNSAEAPGPRRSARGIFQVRREPKFASTHSRLAPSWTSARFVTRLSTARAQFWSAMYRTRAPGMAMTSMADPCSWAGVSTG